jgi:hypothetical protein
MSPDDSTGEPSNPDHMLVKTNMENLDELSSSMTNSLDSKSDPAYRPSLSPTLSFSLSGSNRSSYELVDMVPKIAWNRQGCNDADQAGPSGVHFNLQEMGTEWAGIWDIRNLLWVPATWLSQPSAILSQKQLALVEAEWKKCFHNGPNTHDNSYTSNPSLDYKLEIPGDDERICSYAAAGSRAFFMAYTAMFDEFRIRFPFSDLQIEFLHNLHLAPSQLSFKRSSYSVGRMSGSTHQTYFYIC